MSYIIQPYITQEQDNRRETFEEALLAMANQVTTNGLSPVLIHDDKGRHVCTYWNERAGMVLYVNHEATPEERLLAVGNFSNVSVSIITDSNDELRGDMKNYLVTNPNSMYPSLVAATSETEAASRLIADQDLEPHEGETLIVTHVRYEELSEPVDVELKEEEEGW